MKKYGNFGWTRNTIAVIFIVGCYILFQDARVLFAEEVSWQGAVDGKIYAPETVKNVGIGTASPIAKLHLSNGAFLVEGSTGTIEGLDGLGIGPRLMWIPEKAAFRVGKLTSSTAWDSENLGVGSIGLGSDTLANGEHSIAIGPNAEAYSLAVSIGSGAKAWLPYSTAIGPESSTKGLFSIAIGILSEANGRQSTAIGVGTIADGESSIAIGGGMKNTVDSSLMIGFKGNSSQATEKPSLFADASGVAINGIPDTSATRYALAVYGSIKAEEIVVDTTWADYVFHEDYQLPSIDEVADFIRTNKHLPEVPSEKQIRKEGLKMADMMALQMRKIEELTLYAIQLKQENDVLKTEKAVLKDNQNKLLRNQQEFKRRLQSLESALIGMSEK